jgi:superfamily II DNA or RNA helicase
LAQLTKGILKKELAKYAPKMEAILKKIKKSVGNVLVYSQFITLEGIGIFAKVLEENGYTNYNKDNNGPEYKSFAIFAGTTSDPLRKKILEVINTSDNKYGKNIKIILITSTGIEGINLRNIRQVHIMEPFWNISRIRQIIGRAIRIKSHSDLPIEEREVNSYVYICVPPEGSNIKSALGESLTTDEHLFISANKRQELIDQFLTAMKEISFDCEANFQHNKDEISECRICVPNNKPLFPAKFENHFLPGNRTCQNTKAIVKGLKDVIIDGKKYKQDDAGNIFVPIEGKKNVFIMDPNIKKRNRSKKTK